MTARAIFARATKRGLSILGEPSTLGGLACGNVAISRNVEVFVASAQTANDSQTVRRDVASIESSYDPKQGGILVHPSEGTFRLERKLDDNGHLRRFIVLQQP